ncbi:MAG: hypothetical protein LBG62_03660 [Candidatus Methanoplasma sp.]|jgi:hypothetical protein|nr:hypothetical protein [Candidatus Methanoplasma sp.]
MKRRWAASVLFTALVAASLSLAPLPSQYCDAEPDAPAAHPGYRDQLDVNGRAIFDAVSGADAATFEMVVDLPAALISDGEGAEAYLSGAVEALWRRAMDALKIGAPRAVWLWGESLTTYDRESLFEPFGPGLAVRSLRLSNSPDPAYADDPSTEEDERQQKIDALEKAVEGFSSESGDFRGKVSDINRYLRDRATYDPDYADKDKKSPYDHDAYGALASESGYAVCEGYAKAFQLLAEKIGVACFTVFGTGTPSMEGHAWNYVMTEDGKWYAVDSTWNDARGEDRYFLLGASSFFLDHQQGTMAGSGTVMPFSYPPLEKGDFDAPPETHEEYSWIAMSLIVGIVIAGLIIISRRGSH